MNETQDAYCLKHVSLNILLQFVYISNHYSFMYLPHNTKIHVLPLTQPLLLPSSLLSLNQDGELVAETFEPMYIIPEARPSHRGRYACIAKNSNGITNSSSPGLLTITGKKEGFEKGCSKSLPHPTVN